jgi:excisionase family DNA binding protein
LNLIGVKEVSEILGAKPSTIYQWAEMGQIPSFKLNGLLRFSEEEIMNWVVTCKNTSTEGYNVPTGRRPRKGGKL